MTDARKIQLATELDATGTRRGADEVKAVARDMARDVATSAGQASKAVDGIGAGAAGAAAQVEKADGRIIASLQRRIAMTEAAGKGERALQEALIRSRGRDPELYKPYLDQLEAADRAQRAATGSLDKMGVSAKQTAAALRGVPAQFTDIVTSLASGQQPITVLLQQGGQLKDMFGGIGNAARALGGYVLGLVNPYTLAAVAAGGLTLAHYLGAKEAQAYQRAITLSGNAAGVTAGQLSDVAAAVRSIGAGTQGRAAELLTQMAAAGGVGALQLERFTVAALRLERVGGPAAEETAKAFSDLAKSPLQAATKLNEATNFLTTSVYAQIKALSEQGRTVDAARIAQDAYATAVEQRGAELLPTLGLIERAWLGIKDATKGAVDRVIGLGREEGTLTRIAELQQRIADVKSGRPGAGRLSEMEAELAALRIGSGYEARSAAAAAEVADQRRASRQWLDEGNRFLGRAQQMETAIAAARNQGLAAGVSDLAIQQRIAAIRQQFDPGVDQQRIKDAAALRVEATKRAQIEVDALRATGQLNEQRAIDETTRVALQANSDRRRAIQAELALASKRQDSERDVAALQGQLAQADAERTTIQLKGRRDLEAAIYRQARAIDAVLQAQRQESADEASAFFVQQAQAREAAALSITQYAAAVADEAGALALEVQLVNASSGARATRLAQYKIELDLKRRLTELDKVYFEDGEAGRDRERNRLRAIAARDVANASTRAWLDEWRTATDEINRSLTDALTRAFESGKTPAQALRDVVVNMFKTLVLRPVVQGIFAQSGSNITGLLGTITGTSGAPGAGGSSSGAGLVGQLASLYQQGSTLRSAYNTVAGYFGASAGAGAITGGGGMVAAGSAGYGSIGGAAGSYGTINGSSAALGAGSSSAGLGAAGWAALAVLGAMQASADYSAGFNRTGAKGVASELDLFGGRFKGTEYRKAQFLSSLGFSDRVADLLSGSTALAKIFGRAAPRIEGTGVTGTFGDGGFTGTAYADILEKGGLFRSDKRSTATAPLSAALGAFLTDAAKGVLTQAKDYGRALGLPADEMGKATKAIKVALGADAEANKKALTDALTGYADAVVAGFADVLAPLQAYGETTAQTIERVGGAITRVNDTLTLLGQTALQASVSGGQAAVALEAAFGGAAGFAQASANYLQAFYTDEQRRALAATQLQRQLATVGITTLPGTRQAFRDLVEAQDLTTDSGRAAYAVLLQLSGAFAELTAAAETAGQSIRDEIARLRGSATGADQATLLAQFATGTAAARAGDTKALEGLPAISQALEKAAEATASSALDVARMRAWLADSLTTTLTSIPGFAGGGSFAGGLRIVGEQGPELQATGPARLYSTEQTARLLGGGGQAMDERMAELIDEVKALRDATVATAQHSAKTARLIERAMPDGDAIATRIAAL